MSKQQWGHGYHAGYQDALSEMRQKEIFEAEKHAHWVEIHNPYDDTYEPANHQQCTFLGEHTCQNDGGACGFNRFEFREKGTQLLCAGPPAPIYWRKIEPHKLNRAA